jgi:hypothetical protein
MIEIHLFTFLHLLVFVYWLGGDLGAFYVSRYLTRPGISPEKRLFAAKILGDIDMAPRTALILTLPTGLTLATSRGWIEMSVIAQIAIWGFALAWLGLAWALHMKHGAAPALLRSTDLAIRIGMILALAGSALALVSGAWIGPPFLSWKLLALGACISLGLLIRAVLKPLGPALAGLAGPEAAAAEAQLSKTLNQARPLVVAIWTLLIAAALMGLVKPT